jgi:hypothetical protein
MLVESTIGEVIIHEEDPRLFVTMTNGLTATRPGLFLDRAADRLRG